MKSLIIGLPIVIACLVALALAIVSMALADAHHTSKSYRRSMSEAASILP